MDLEQILDWARTAPLKELAPLLRLLAARLYEHRLAHNGYVPPELFEPSLGIGGVTVSSQIVNEVVDADGKRIGFALKRREKGEIGWEGLHHNTCCTFRLTDTPDSALLRNVRETFQEIPAEEELEVLGVTVHHEPERQATCVTLMYRRQVAHQDVVRRFAGTWKLFSEEDIRNRNPELVDHNCWQLEWVMDKSRETFAAIQGGYPTKP